MQWNVIKTMDWQKLFYLNLGLRKLMNADKLLDICMKNICRTKYLQFFFKRYIEFPQISNKMKSRNKSAKRNHVWT